MIVFTVIKKTMGLRVSENTEIVGLDKCEHGLSSSYADLLNTAQFITAAADSKPAFWNTNVNGLTDISLTSLRSRFGSV